MPYQCAQCRAEAPVLQTSLEGRGYICHRCYRTELLKHRRVLCFDHGLLLDLLNTPRRGSLLRLPDVAEIPFDVEIVSVWPDQCRRCLMVEIVHPTFEIVQEGAYAPILPDFFGSSSLFEVGPELKRVEG